MLIINQFGIQKPEPHKYSKLIDIVCQHILGLLQPYFRYRYVTVSLSLVSIYVIYLYRAVFLGYCLAHYYHFYCHDIWIVVSHGTIYNFCLFWLCISRYNSSHVSVKHLQLHFLIDEFMNLWIDDYEINYVTAIISLNTHCYGSLWLSKWIIWAEYIMVYIPLLPLHLGSW